MIWNYGTAGDHWPVQPGDIWQAGPALLACLDLQTPAATEFFRPLDFQMVYCDPPYNAALARGFRTKAGLPSRPVDFDNLLLRILHIAERCSGLTFIEIGLSESARIRFLASATLLQLLAEWPITYYKIHSSCLLCFQNKQAAPHVLIDNPEGMDDNDTPLWTITHYTQPGDRVIDPCTGRGLTCRSAVQANRVFAGTELHPRRLAVVLDWLNQQGHSPVHIGNL